MGFPCSCFMKTYKPRSAGGRADRGKGLRHFSLKVCQSVQRRGRTTYKEVTWRMLRPFSCVLFTCIVLRFVVQVADELVAEFDELRQSDVKDVCVG